ncbi:nucleotidyltransferase domain-containing protein [Pseudomonas alliivorans]|nr:nucleotidyltransferase domain-containing protein [Pseudomonas alliivorans]MEE4699716.1 nucleotidyltransferase domain-containing protein [Pseudomonas alliivorans]MEE4735695.1 nucleotidyltransferase domain-containing protein [Pseudomonas alliivorans]
MKRDSTEAHPLDDTMRARVLDELARIERERNVTVLYACESGSRAWGFASTDSDYDVRFVYVEKPEWFVQVNAGRDVIERPLDDELDVSGWELRKTLGLLRKSNPTLLEWLDSPLVYRSESEATARLRALAEAFYSPPAARNHYLSMARKNFRGYLQGESVRFKKYFYVLRPLLAVRWIDQGRGRPPMTFADLLSTVDDPLLLDEVAELLVLKRRANEAAYGPRRSALHAFITAELERSVPVLPRTHVDSGLLDQYLRETVANYTGSRT